MQKIIKKFIGNFIIGIVKEEVNRILMKKTGTFLIALAEFMSCIHAALKFYKVLCFTKMVFDLLPLVSPYNWPLSFVKMATLPYLNFCKSFIPMLRFGNVPYDVSILVGLEILNVLRKFSITFRDFLLLEAKKLIEKASY